MGNHGNVNFKKMLNPAEGMIWCFNCGWNWKPRKENPKSCPRCKTYKWKEKVK